jgi:glycosyltransferase domain-containing protein
MAGAAEMVTVVVPTYNRREFLPRIAENFKDSGLRVIVADSTEQVGDVDPVVLRGCEYHRFPGLPFAEKLGAAVSLVDTPYVVLCADDDFIVPEAAVACSTALSRDDRLSSAQGHYLSLACRPDGLKVARERITVTEVDDFRFTGFSGDDPMTRLRRYFADYTQLVYCVHRVENLRLAAELAGDVVTGQPLELVFGVAAMISGNHLHIHDLYGVRQFMASSGAHIFTGIDDMVYGRTDRGALDRFVRRCAPAVAAAGDITDDEASSLLDDCLRTFVASQAGSRSQWRRTRLRVAALNSAGPVGRKLRELKRGHRIPISRLKSGSREYDVSEIADPSADIADLQLSGNERRTVERIVRIVSDNPSTMVL